MCGTLRRRNGPNGVEAHRYTFDRATPNTAHARDVGTIFFSGNWIGLGFGQAELAGGAGPAAGVGFGQVAGIQGWPSAARIRTSSMFWPWRTAVAV